MKLNVYLCNFLKMYNLTNFFLFRFSCLKRCDRNISQLNFKATFSKPTD